MGIGPCPQEAHGLVERALMEKNEVCAGCSRAAERKRRYCSLSFPGLGTSVDSNSWDGKRRGPSRQRRLLMPRETKEHASFGDKSPRSWSTVCEYGSGETKGLRGSSGPGDKRPEGVVRTWITESLACLRKASGWPSV